MRRVTLPRAAARLPGEEQLFGTEADVVEAGEIFSEGKVLMHHADAGGQRGAGGAGGQSG
jgi:hypothetical protein